MTEFYLPCFLRVSTFVLLGRRELYLDRARSPTRRSRSPRTGARAERSEKAVIASSRRSPTPERRRRRSSPSPKRRPSPSPKRRDRSGSRDRRNRSRSRERKVVFYTSWFLRFKNACYVVNYIRTV